MDAYTSFAEVYDLFMDNIPYDEWCEYVVSLLKEQGIDKGILLDLGCGTGNLTQLLSEYGYDMIGVDNSEDMLMVARRKLENADKNILYLLQDMREFELYGTVSAVISICDSLNYILEIDELVEIFKLVNNYLDPKGVFIFDLNTEYKYRELLGDETIAENREESSFIWENFYDEENQINEYDLTIFTKTEDNRYYKYCETHYQRAYSLKLVKDALGQAGMEFLGAYDAFTKESPKADSERIYVVAREHGKHPAGIPIWPFGQE